MTIWTAFILETLLLFGFIVCAALWARALSKRVDDHGYRLGRIEYLGKFDRPLLGPIDGLRDGESGVKIVPFRSSISDCGYAYLINNNPKYTETAKGTAHE